jgi:hypothetical protein
MEYWRWHLAEQYGWTLDYVDSLSMDDMQEYYQVQDGLVKARSELRMRNGNKSSKSVRGNRR